MAHYESLITLLAGALVLYLIYFLDTVLAVNLENTFGLTGDNVGYAYIPSMVLFLIMCPIVAHLCKIL